MKCSDYGIVPVIKVIKSVFLMIEVIAPILAIVALMILLMKLMIYPKEKNQIEKVYKSKIKNTIISFVIIFFLPVFINLVMIVLGENFEVSSCWNNAEKITFSGTGTYYERGNKRNKIIGEKNYDKGYTGSAINGADSSLSVSGSTEQEKWLNTLEAVGKKLVSLHFVYSNSDNKRTLEEAARTNKRTNCAHYVSLAMQEYGLLPKGKTIWLNNKINGNGADYIKKSKKVTIYYPNKGINNLKLQPGDIVGWKSSGGQHTTVYAGKSKGGKLLWFSGGSGDVSSKNYGPKQKGYGNRTVHVVIRPNFNSM